MSAAEWAGMILAIFSIMGIFISGMRWFINTQFRVELRKEVKEIVQEIVSEEIRIVKHELTNNGGSSTKDKIDFIYNKLKDE